MTAASGRGCYRRSIAYGNVMQARGGTIAVDSEVAVFTEWVVNAPREMFANEGGRA